MSPRIITFVDLDCSPHTTAILSYIFLLPLLFNKCIIFRSSLEKKKRPIANQRVYYNSPEFY